KRVEQGGERVSLGGWCRVGRQARAEIAEARWRNDSTVGNQVADAEQSPDAGVEDSMHHEHAVAGSSLGVLDGTPWCRDDVAFHGSLTRARRLHIPSVPQEQAGCGDRDRAGSKRHGERWFHDAPPTARSLASSSSIVQEM